ncbi:Uncharacterised protein [Escherichia coli]|nr:Uncharacterised protein [Escherichia coli]
MLFPGKNMQSIPAPFEYYWIMVNSGEEQKTNNHGE